MKRWKLAAMAALCLPSAQAWAAPGMGQEVYGATVDKGEFEVESRYDRLAGGPDDGEDVIKLEAAYGAASNLRLGITTELEREVGEHRRAEEIGLEAIYALGNAGGLDFAVYGEYAIGLNGHSDAVEAKLLVQHRKGPFDARLNLIAEKELEHGAKIEFGYAASADYEVLDEIRVGAQAFGELGTANRLFPHAEHFIGPVVKAEIEGLGPEIELQAGYLFALGKAKEDTDGQLRFALELEF